MRVSTIGLLIAPVLLVFFYLSYLHPLTTGVDEEALLHPDHTMIMPDGTNNLKWFNDKNKNGHDTRRGDKLQKSLKRDTPTQSNKKVIIGEKTPIRRNSTKLEDLLKEMAFNDSHLEANVWNPYVQFHKKMLKSTADASKKRFAVYQCRGGCGGMGDRVSGMISVLWFAILTDRAFLIDWTQPFEFTEFFDSPIEWKFKHPMIEREAASFGFIDWSPDGIASMQKNNVIIHTNVFNLKLAVWKDRESINRATKLGFTYSNRHNFRLLSNFLFRPKPIVQKVIDEFKAKSGWLPSNQTKVIGLQIRTGSGVSEGERISKKGIQQFFECAQKATDYYFKGQNVKWYLTTDSYQVEESAMKEYGDRVIVYKGKIVHTDKTVFSSAEESTQAAIKTLADWWMLGETDFNIISRSMFGWTASWKSGHPWVIGDGECRLMGPEIDVIADPAYPAPPLCGKGWYEKCHVRLDPVATNWEIGDAIRALS